MNTNYGIVDIMEIIPHRSPFLLVDRIIEIRSDHMEATGLKSVSYNEPFFTGHFPGKPVMPGVLQLEAMAQTSAFLVLKFDEASRSYRGLALTGVKNVKFRKPVVPGDLMIMKVKIVRKRVPFYTFEGKVTVEGNLVCEAQWNAVFLDKEDSAE